MVLAWREWMRRWRGDRGKRRGAVRRDTALPATGAATRAAPWEAASLAAEPVLSMPGETPFAMFRVYRYLRDHVPDVSDAIWTWKRLCQTGYDVALRDVASESEETTARAQLAALEARVNQGDRGMDGLLDIFYESLFTYGAAAVELVPGARRTRLADVVPVDVPSLRFRREGGRNALYQYRDGELRRLPEARAIYVGLDRDGTNPYGRSMLRSLPGVIKIQQRLLEDMAEATRNAGWNKLHVTYRPEDPEQGEEQEAYQARMQEDLARLRDMFSGLRSDQNLVTFDNVGIDVLRGQQSGHGFYENHKAVEEQVITGMHLMPILLGRNYGTTETYGTVQYEIINRQVETVNRSVRRMLEQVFNHELAMALGRPRATVQMRANRTTDALKAEQARGEEIANVLRLRDEGLIDAQTALTMLRLPGRARQQSTGLSRVRYKTMEDI